MDLRTPTVDLISYTQDALELLIATKSTRLQGRVTIEDIKGWPIGRKLEELSYMRDTIKSSWEFVHYIFHIQGVSRSFTHQFVRTRTQSSYDDPALGVANANPAIAMFAQESHRTVDASENGFVMPPVKEENREWFEKVLVGQSILYQTALDMGEPPQNARFLLPHAVATGLIAGYTLRALHDMAEARLCTRTQGEYQDVFRMIRERVIEVHPWAEPFINVFCVNHGTCCFPRYSKCPIQGMLFNPETGLRHDMAQTTDGVHVVMVPARPAKRSEILVAWKEIRHEATPVAKDGRTQ
jgi:hypothetical protein